MLRADPRTAEVLARFALRKHLIAARAELRQAAVAPKVIVLALADNHSLAARTVARLLPKLRRIHKLRQETSLVRTRLGPVHMVGLLVPAPDLLVIKEAALARREVVIAIDLLAAAPAKVNLAVPTVHLAAALGLLDCCLATWTALRCPREVTERHQLCTRGRRRGPRPHGPGLQGLHAVVGRGTLGAWVVGPTAAAAEGEHADTAQRHMVLVLNARRAMAVPLRVAPRAEDYVLHTIEALLQAELLVAGQRRRVRP
mmetsp:Transcript_75664/g.167560  ORF Transcript_75664/g.167560 Transcript_75664/m.167560 type:complete len:257 (-) Transcript_75664:378-1148(-)